MKIDVSIIIPVYKVEQYIVECLQSVCEQRTTANIECILVDDCGGDESMSIAMKYLSQHKFPHSVHILKHESNRGLSAARNTGVKRASGEYLYFLDSDDYITSDCIESLYKTAKEFPNSQIITGDVDTFPEKGLNEWISLRNKNLPAHINDPSEVREIWFEKFPTIQCNKLINREWLLSNGLFFREGIINEDNVWQVDSYSHIQACATCNKVTYLYRKHPNSITSGQSVHTETMLEVVKLNVMADSLCSAKIYDAPILRFIAGKLLYLRACSEPEARNLLKRFNDLIWTNHSAPMRLKLFVTYLLLPRVVMRYGLAQRIIDFNTLSKSAH